MTKTLVSLSIVVALVMIAIWLWPRAARNEQTAAESATTDAISARPMEEAFLDMLVPPNGAMRSARG